VLFLVELSFNQLLDFQESVGAIVSFNYHGNAASRPGGEHHQTHDAFAIHGFAILFDKDVAPKPIGHFHEHGGGTRVDSQFIQDHKVSLFTRWFFTGAHRMSIVAKEKPALPRNL
jgi:hypothetical protein